MWWENQGRNLPEYRKVSEGLAGETIEFQKINKGFPCWKLTYYLASATPLSKRLYQEKCEWHIPGTLE